MRYSPGDCIDNRYEVRDRLGEGAMAEVYRAFDRHNQRDVVLKLPHLAIGGDLAAFRRYRHEMQIAQGLSHPGLQHVLSPPNAPCIVLEYVEGESLRAYLARHGPLNVEDVRRIGLQLAQTLEYVHAHGIVHRDVKPENILIQPPNRVTLTDFGIAERVRAPKWWRFAHLENAVGTPDYMAPEQVRGEGADPRTDVYALGSVLYELLTGRVPYPATERSDALPLVRHVRPDVPPALEAALYTALRRRPTERYQSMADLAYALEHQESVAVPTEYAPDEPPPKPIGDLPPWRTTLVLVGVVLLVLVVIGVLAQLAPHVRPH